ncbi:MAG: ATP-dependent helicase RhlE [Pseudomonadota bacterium]|jgi:superfamily II DNA/RNA helicase
MNGATANLADVRARKNMTDAFEVQADLSPAQSSTNETFVTETLALDAADVNDNEAIDAEITPEQPNGFVLLGLAPELVQAVADLGYTQPTPVQLKAIPLALPKETLGEAHRYIDLMVSSQTGSGKTAAFLLPVLHTLLQEMAAEEEAERAAFAQACSDAAANGEPAPKRPKRKDPTNSRNFKAPTPGALIVCPTRELAQQVAHDAIDLVKHCRGLRVANIVGGMPYQLQIAKLQNANLVVATPGRLLDLQRSMQIKLDKVKFLVVDEADRMLDLGFSDDLADINQLTSQRQQTMMFSATFAPRIQQLAMRVMHDGGSSVQKIQIDSPQEKHSNIKQVLFWADNAQHKRKLLDHWLRDASINQAIVFASTQIECDGLAADLQQDGFDAVALHGALSQGLRNRRLMALRNGQVQILVATDVAARGIDVPTITHVFNFGLPMKAEDYTHRIGRTGRAGRDGLAITFAEIRDRRKILDIEAYSRQPFKAEVIPGMEPKQNFPESRPGGRGGNDRGDRGGRGRPFGGGGGGGFGGNRGGDRFESRGAPRFEGNRGGDRFEGRGDRFENRGAPAPRFEGRPEGRGDFRPEARPEGRFEPRGDFRGEQRSFAPRGGEARFEPRGDQRPDNRGGDRFDSRDSRAPRAPSRDNARGGASDRPARGPKVMGAGNFKPHNAGGHAAPKRTGAKVLKITRG